MKHRYFLSALSIIAVLSTSGCGLRSVRSDQPTLAEEANRTLGGPKAPNTFTVFSDFSCPYCKDLSAVLKDLVKAYPNDVRVVFKHFPLGSRNANVVYAAEAAECAGDQNRFWDYHDLLYGDINGWYPRRNVKARFLKFAKTLKLDMSKFEACYDSQEKRRIVRSNRNEGLALKVDATPRLFFNGAQVMGERDFESLKKLIEETVGKQSNRR